MLLYKGLSDVLLNKKVSLSDADASRCVNTYAQAVNSKKHLVLNLLGKNFWLKMQKTRHHQYARWLAVSGFKASNSQENLLQQTRLKYTITVL